MKTLLLLIPSLLLGQALSIDCGSPSDQFFSCSPPNCDKFTISTPGATGDLTLRFGAVKYNIPAEPGAYDVTLYLRETGTVTGPGQRSFNVAINGQPVLVNYDLFADSGLAPVQKTFTAASVEFIDIDFAYNVIPGQPVVRGAVVSRIDIAPKQQAPSFPRQISETISLSVVQDSQTQLNYTLSKTPVQDGQMIVFLKSVLVGRDYVAAVKTAAQNPKDLEITLPEYRPLTGDSILVLYWTSEP